MVLVTIFYRQWKRLDAILRSEAEAQRLGYAEAEPSFDVDGIDAAHKLTILAAIAFGHKPDFNAVSIQGIRDVSSVDFTHANQLGFRIKLVALLSRDCAAHANLLASRQPARWLTVFLMPSSSMANRLAVFSLPGAGGGATSSAVLSDLIDIANRRGGLTFGRSINKLVDANAVKNCAGPDKPFMSA